jgi:UDP-glucose:(heptosyl)LPS alpha-1,3-glucosyltransferase
MNIYNPHEGVERAYLKQDFLSVSNPGYFFYKYLKRYLSPEHYLKIWIQKKQYLSPRVKRIIAISKMIKKDIIRYYGVSEEKIAVVFNCVDLDRFHPRNREIHRNRMREKLGIDPELIVLLFIGNNYRLKGLEPLLSSLALLRERFPERPFRLLVLGRGHRGRYRRLAKRIGVSDLILFLGHVREVEQVYSASDIYVHPTFYDSCSLTVLEALATGLPVITSRFNGAADAILSKEGGEVIETPANVKSLAESIAYYFDEDRREKARVVTRQWMEKYSPANHIEDILRVYYEVAKEEGC